MIKYRLEIEKGFREDGKPYIYYRPQRLKWDFDYQDGTCDKNKALKTIQKWKKGDAVPQPNITYEEIE
jgi:hypothetical protein